MEEVKEIKEVRESISGLVLYSGNPNVGPASRPACPEQGEGSETEGSAAILAASPLIYILLRPPPDISQNGTNHSNNLQVKS